MKMIFSLVQILMLCGGAALASGDCEKTAAACRPQAPAPTSFMAEIKKASVPGFFAAPAEAGAPAPGPTAGTAAPAPEAGKKPEPSPAGGAGKLASPAWLPAAAALLAALYWFLRPGGKKRRK